eukprot:10072469-Lingulodinium_polyedra.AAC.1
MVGAPRRPAAASARHPARPPARPMAQQIMPTLWMMKPTSAETRNLKTHPFHGRQQEVRDAQH